MPGDGEDDGNSGEDVSCSPPSLLRTEIVPLSAAFHIINGAAESAQDMKLSEYTNSAASCTDSAVSIRRVRIIRPYPYTFATFAKARWIGRTVVDIYHEEFGE